MRPRDYQFMANARQLLSVIPRFKMLVCAPLLLLLVVGSTASPVVPPYDTIVVGLGAAGTTAAATLARAGKRVLALEAQDRVGGRVWTRPFSDGIVEAGAEWIHGQVHSRVYELAVQNNVSVLVQEMLPKVYRSDGSGGSDQLTDLLIYGLDLMEEGSDINESMRQLIERGLRQHLQTKNPELLNDKDAMDSFLELMDLMVDSFEGSSDWNDVTALKGYDSLEGSQTTSWNRHGYKTFFEILLNIYQNGPGLSTLDIKLSKEVTSIQWNNEGGVLVTCRDGDQYSAGNVIVTVSLGVLKERHAALFSPPLTQEKITAIDILTIGVVDKIIFQLDKPWPVEDSLMFYWNAEDKKRVPDEDKWVTKILGTSAPAGSNNTITLWVLGETAKLIETLPEEVVKRKSVELLQRFLGPNIVVPQPVAMIRTTWFSNPFTRGSYTYDNLETRSRPGLRNTLAAPLLDAAGTPRVLFAGEATHSTRFSTVHGASDTGFREAQRLLTPNTI